MADPGPVAQTFFTDEEIGNYYLLDSILTVVDAQARAEAARRVPRGAGAGWFRRPHPDVEDRPGFRTMKLKPCRNGCKRMNPRAPIKKVQLRQRADRRGARHPRLQPERDPRARPGVPHRLAPRAPRRGRVVRLQVGQGRSTARSSRQFLSGMIQVYGPDLLRYKGVLWMKGNPRRVVFQGVHMMMGGDMGKPWAKSETEGIGPGVHRQEAAEGHLHRRPGGVPR